MLKTTANPLVSILMPVYNAEFFIEQSIEAILSQSFFNFEFIIINDGSSDKSKERILSYNDRRIRFFENPINLGIVKTLNWGLSLAKGKYVLRTDADDYAKENMVSSLVDFMENNPDYVVCGANMNLIGSDLTITYPNSDVDLKVYTLNSCPFSHSVVIFRLDVLRSNGLSYDGSLKDAEDHGLWSKLLPHGKFKNLNMVLLMYRESFSQITALPSYKNNVEVAHKRILAMHARDFFGLNKRETEYYIQLILCSQVDASSLIEIGKLYLNLFKSNNISRYFHSGSLEKFLFIKWYFICLYSNLKLLNKTVIYCKYSFLSGHWLRAIYHLFSLLGSKKNKNSEFKMGT